MSVSYLSLPLICLDVASRMSSEAERQKSCHSLRVRPLFGPRSPPPAPRLLPLSYQESLSCTLSFWQSMTALCIIRPRGMWLQVTYRYPRGLTPYDWHTFCLLASAGSYSLLCCVQPGWVSTCPRVGSARTWYRGQCRPPIAPVHIDCGSCIDQVAMGKETGKDPLCIASTARL
jgi:hypothetical protein